MSDYNQIYSIILTLMIVQTSDLKEEYLDNYMASKIVMSRYKAKHLKLVRKLSILFKDSLLRKSAQL